MTRGLAEKHGLQLVAARGARTFPSILEISRRTHLPVSALVQLAKADAFRSHPTGSFLGHQGVA
jgi:error-prone DNA polymerase